MFKFQQNNKNSIKNIKIKREHLENPVFIQTYANNREIYAKDIQTKEDFEHFIEELINLETVLTKTGFEVLENHYGLERLAELIISKRQNAGYTESSQEEAISFLKSRIR